MKILFRGSARWGPFDSAVNGNAQGRLLRLRLYVIQDKAQGKSGRAVMGLGFGGLKPKGDTAVLRLYARAGEGGRN